RQFRLAGGQRPGRGAGRGVRRQHPFAGRRLRLRRDHQPHGCRLHRGGYRGPGQGLRPQGPGAGADGPVSVRARRTNEERSTEIMLGSRSDPELARRFKPVAEEILRRQRVAASVIAQREGIEDVSELEVMVWVSMAAIRGMTLMELAGVDPGLTEKALRMIGR